VAKQRNFFSHERSSSGKDEWLTPPWILEELGTFDLDPCAPVNRPWDTARKHYTIEDNGLTQPWTGRVWCNPPYSDIDPWLVRMAHHQNGTVLCFARTDTTRFYQWVWPKATGLLFLKGRLAFHHVDGRQADNSSGAPSVLIAYGEEDAQILKNCNIQGAYVTCEKVI